MTDPRSTPSIPVAPEDLAYSEFFHGQYWAELNEPHRSREDAVGSDCEICWKSADDFMARFGEARPTPVGPEAPHPIMAKYGLETMQGDPLVILERHLVNNHAATVGGWKLVAERARERMEAAESRLAVEPDGLPLDVRSDVQHALEAINAALDKASYGDSVESDLFEAHATLDTLLGGTPSEAKP